MTRNDAIEECLNNPSISPQAKVVLTQMQNQLQKIKSKRPPSQKSIDNYNIKAHILNNVTHCGHYSLSTLVKIAKETGIANISEKRVLGIMANHLVKTNIYVNTPTGQHRLYEVHK